MTVMDDASTLSSKSEDNSQYVEPEAPSSVEKLKSRISSLFYNSTPRQDPPEESVSIQSFDSLDKYNQERVESVEKMEANSTPMRATPMREVSVEGTSARKHLGSLFNDESSDIKTVPKSNSVKTKNGTSNKKKSVKKKKSSAAATSKSVEKEQQVSTESGASSKKKKKKSPATAASTSAGKVQQVSTESGVSSKKKTGRKKSSAATTSKEEQGRRYSKRVRELRSNAKN